MPYAGRRRLLVVLATAAALLGAGAAAPVAAAPVAAPPAAAAATSAAAVAVAASGVPGTFVAVPPTRVMDTRRGLGTAGPVGPASFPSRSWSAHVLGTAGVPATGVRFVTVTVTVTAPTAGGYVTPYTATAVNFAPGQTIADFAVAPVDASGDISMTAYTSGTLQLVVDVNGYVREGTPRVSGTLSDDFTPAPGRRLLDTRMTGGPVPAHGSVTVELADMHMRPLSGALLTVAVTGPKAAGTLTVSPTGSPVPVASSLNFVAGQTVANSVLAAAGAGQQVTITNNGSGPTHVVVDELAGLAAGTPLADGTVAATTPYRAVDTRRSQGATGPVVAGSAIRFPVLGRGGVPATGVTAVVLNVTATATTAGGYAAAYPGGGARPGTSILNYARGQTVPGMTIVQVGADGTVAVAVGGNGSAHLVVDVEGYVLTGAVSAATTTWTRTGGVDPTAGTPYASACSSRTSCLAVDTLGGTYAYDGTTWSRRSDVPVAGPIWTLSCASPTLCAGVGRRGVATWDGSGWTWSSVFPATLGTWAASVACVAPATCVAASDGQSLAVRSGAGAWVVTAVSGAGAMSVSCSGPTHCVAIDRFGTSFTYDGSGWTRGADFPVWESWIDSITCPTTTWCRVGGILPDDSEVTAVLDDAGYSGLTPLPLGSLGDPAHVACGSPTTCVAWASGAGTVTATPNGAWQPPVALTPASLPAMSCPEADWCAGLDSIGRQVVLSGGALAAPAPAIQPTGGLRAASCPAAGHCVAVDAAGDSMVLDAGAWSAPVLLDRGYALQRVSCPTVSFCAATDARGAVVTGDGRTWGDPVVVDPGHRLPLVSCAAAGSCVVVDDAARAAVLSAGTWSTPSALPQQGASPSTPRALACASATTCAVVDGAGHLYWWDGSTWAPHAGDPTTLLSLSCPSATSCLGQTTDGALWRWDGRAWSSTYVATDAYGQGFACGSSGRCTALFRRYDTGAYEAVSSVGGLWTAPSGVALSAAPTSLACDPAGLCLGLDGTDAVSSFVSG